MSILTGENVVETIINYVLLAICIATLFTAVRGLITFISEKEKAVIASKAELLNDLAFVFAFAALFFIDMKNNFMFGIVAVCDLIVMPFSSTTVLTPKGICKKNCLKQKYVPVSDLSYEFKDDKLDMHFSDKQKAVTYQYGVKKTNTVKMLADWYPKYEYKNPIVPEEDNENSTANETNND